MLKPTTRFVTARVKRSSLDLFADRTFRLTLRFNGSRVVDDEIAYAELKRKGYIVNTIISQRGPSGR